MTGDRTPLLSLRGVTIAAEDDVICRDVNLEINPGETHILLGPNGSGKSTVMGAVMGIRPYRIIDGEAVFRGRDLTGMEVDERARAGIGLAFQRPPALTGVTVARLAHAIDADDALAAACADLDLGHLAEREVNDGFSGGETKRFEVLKLHLQSPDLCLFDEPESGVDLQQVGVVGRAIRDLLDSPAADGGKRAGLIITHTGFILDSLEADAAHLMVDGTIVASGEPGEMFETIRREGYGPAGSRREAS